MSQLYINISFSIPYAFLFFEIINKRGKESIKQNIATYHIIQIQAATLLSVQKKNAIVKIKNANWQIIGHISTTNDIRIHVMIFFQFPSNFLE
jgi:hypothetical protein